MLTEPSKELNPNHEEKSDPGEALLRVVVVYTEGGMMTNPSLFALLNYLSPHFSIDLLTELPIDVEIKNVTNHYAHQHAVSDQRKTMVPDRLRQSIKSLPFVNYLLSGKAKIKAKVRQVYAKKKGFGPLYRHVKGSPQWATPEFVRLVQRRCKREVCDVVIALDVKELIVSHQAVKDVPIIYHSLELRHFGESDFFHTHLKPLKEAEGMAFKDVATVIIQDEERARFLWESNNCRYEPEKVILFPHSYIGNAAVRRSNYFCTLFPELRRQPLLVQMGTICQHRRSDELIKIATMCPERFFMIFHGFSDNSLKREIESIGAPRCRYSRPVESFRDVEEVASGVDVGLVFYLADNFSDILAAHASSQYCLFMKCGVPVLTGNAGSLSRIVRRYRCGIVVEDLTNLFSSADEIMSDYETYSRNAVRCFESELQLAHYSEPLIKRIHTIATSQSAAGQ